MKPEEGYNLYRKSLTKLAKENRRKGNPAEDKLWYEILRARKTGFKFLRQKPINHFILDFYCSKLLLAIEADGDSHAEREDYDERRTEILNNLGIRVIRYTNEEILSNIDGVWEDLMEKLRERKKELHL